MLPWLTKLELREYSIFITRLVAHAYGPISTLRYCTQSYVRYCGFPNFTDFLTRQACVPEEQAGGCFVRALVELGGRGLECCGLAALLATGIRGHFCAITSLTGTGLSIDATDTPSTPQTIQLLLHIPPYPISFSSAGKPKPFDAQLSSSASPPRYRHTGSTRQIKPSQWSPTDYYSLASQNQKEIKPSNLQNPPATTLCSVMPAHYRTQRGGRERDRIGHLYAAQWRKRWISYESGLGHTHNPYDCPKVCPRIMQPRLIF